MKRKTFIASLIAIAGMLSPSAYAQLLKGTARLGEEYEFAVNYLPEGNLFLAQLNDVEVKADGSYTFDMDMAESELDVQIFVNDKVFGVHLEKGKTAVLNIAKGDDGEYQLSFSGDNAVLSKVVSKMYETYDLMTYSSMDGEGPAPAEQLARFEADSKEAMKMVKLIKDKDRRAYYQKMFDAQYRSIKSRILQDVADSQGKKPEDLPEYNAIIETIDVNSDVDYLATNSILWLVTQAKEPMQYKGDAWPAVKDLMDVTDKYVTNPRVRKQMAYMVANQFFSYGDHETNKEVFWTAYKEFAKDYPEFIEAFTPEYNRVVLSIEGKPLPEFSLTKPDGSSVSSASLKGKYTYVDVWATWCGPCCKEIPFLEKVVEDLKDNGKLQFVSISVDSDRNAWQRKLDKDKPTWQQYILDASANNTLSQALNITGIPRFFILDPEGNVISADALRPSSEEIRETLKALTEE